MNPSLQLLLFGLALLLVGGGAVYLLLVLGERLGRWITAQMSDHDDDKP